MHDQYEISDDRMRQYIGCLVVLHKTWSCLFISLMKDRAMGIGKNTSRSTGKLTGMCFLEPGILRSDCQLNSI